MAAILKIERDKSATPNPGSGGALDEGELLIVTGPDGAPPANGTRGDLWVGTADGNLQIIDADAEGGVTGGLTESPQAPGDNYVVLNRDGAPGTATYAMQLQGDKAAVGAGAVSDLLVFRGGAAANATGPLLFRILGGPLAGDIGGGPNTAPKVRLLGSPLAECTIEDWKIDGGQFPP